MGAYNNCMFLSGGRGRGDQGAPTRVEGREPSAADRARQLQEQMENYIDLVRKKAPPEKIKEAEKQISDNIGKDKFRLFKGQLLKQLRVRRSLDAQRVYRHFRLPGRHRVVHDRRGEGRARGRPERGRGRRPAGRTHVREGKLVRETARRRAGYFIDRSRLGVETAKPETKARVDELLSKFEQLIIKRFEGDKQVARKGEKGKSKFKAKSEKQWKQFFQRFAGRILRKRVRTSNVRDFVFRGLVPKEGKGVVISDMTLASGRVERFIRFSIIAEAMAKLTKMIPGDKFGKDMLTGEELYYLALAVARGREYRTGPRPTEGRFMTGVAEERASRDLGLPLAAHLERKAKDLRKGTGLGAFKGWKEREPGPEEPPYQFIPWWHWGNLKRPGKFRMTTVAFYIGLGLIALIGIAAITAHLLK